MFLGGEGEGVVVVMIVEVWVGWAFVRWEWMDGWIGGRGILFH